MGDTSNLLSRRANSIIGELNKEEIQELIKDFSIFLEELESKVDPEPIELQLVENLYQFFEKLKLLEGMLLTYTKGSGGTSIGEKISKIMENNTPYGTSVLWE